MKKIDIYKSENVDFDTNKEIKAKRTKKYIYKFIFLCPINKLDCVNSMDIYDDLLIYGTIMGNLQLCHIDKDYLYPKLKINKLLNKDEEDKKSDISDKNTDKNSNDKKVNEIPSIRLNKYKEKENLNFSEDNVDSHYNLTYCNVNDINNEIEEKNNQKLSNKLNTKKIFISKNLNKKEKDQKEKENSEELIYTNKFENLENSDISLIPYPQITNLISQAGENISCVVFQTKDIIIVSVGDEELFKMEKISTLNTNNPESKFDYIKRSNYQNKTLHLINCENTICFLTPYNFLLLNMSLADFSSSSIKQEEINYINKNIKIFEKPETIKGVIESSNFTIPFDFDGIRFLYLEFIEENSRKIQVYDTINQKFSCEQEINKDFGHISYMKFFSDDKIFLVRKYILCEIYEINEMNKELILVEKWEHFGKEIIAVQIYLEGSKLSEDFIEDKLNDNDESNNISFNMNEKEDEKIINIKLKNMNQINSSSRELKIRHKQELSNDILNKNEIEIFNRKKYKEEILDLNIYNKYGNNKNINPNKKNQKIYFVATLDINGNFNLYNNKQNEILFNLYNIEGIEQKYKDEEFFFFGFPYYITMNSKYICISTDQGIFVIKKIKL
jgi:hypothetical protein